MNRFFSACVDILYPKNYVCCLCGREDHIDSEGLCPDCRKELRLCVNPVVPRPLDGLAAGLLYDDPVKPAIHRLKYSEASYLAEFFAQFMHIPETWRVDCMCPVPLHPFKEWLRSYNQCTLLCRALGKRYPALPIREDLVCRSRYTVSQTKVGGAARKANVRNAFIGSIRAKGLDILLVDDVTTTHSTLCACADALKQAGANRVYALCACQTPSHS